MYKSKNHSKLKAGDNVAHSWSKLKTCTFSEQRRYKMIGQHKNKMIIESWKRNQTFPRFILIIGEIGSGRYTLSRMIAESFSATEVVIDKSVSNIKETITSSYNINDKICYIFKDIDEMSINAKNSILKVIEEPPNQAYFIMTTKDINLVFDTIKSRAFIINMQPYTKEQLQEFNTNETVLRYCNTPGMCKITNGLECTKLSSLVENIILNMLENTGSNLIKICKELNDKDFNYDLFWSIFNKEIEDCGVKIQKAYINNLNNIDLKMKNKSINKAMLLQTFILNMYKEVKLSAVN